MTTARDSYNSWSDEVDRQVDILKKALQRHRVEFNGDDQNRGYIGDLIEIRNKLQEVNSFVSKYVEE